MADTPQSTDQPTQEKAPVPETKSSPEAPKNSEAPGLWISKSKNVKALLYCYFDKDGEVVSVTNTPLAEDVVKSTGLTESRINAEFQRPTRKQIDRYRDRSGRWHPDAQGFVVNRSQVKNLLLKHHLVDIDITDPNTHKKLDLNIKDGRISDEAEQILDDLHPTVVETLLNEFIVRADIFF
jgi:hypothetical protein